MTKSSTYLANMNIIKQDGTLQLIEVDPIGRRDEPITYEIYDKGERILRDTDPKWAEEEYAQALKEKTNKH